MLSIYWQSQGQPVSVPKDDFIIYQKVLRENTLKVSYNNIYLINSNKERKQFNI